MKDQAFVSLIIVIDKPYQSINHEIHQIHQELNQHYSDYEIVIILQGMTLSSSFNTELSILLNELSCIRLIQLSSCVNKDSAWAAGLENAIGDFVVLLDHVRDPVSSIVDIVKLCKSGHDVVIGVSEQRQSLPYRMSYFIARKILNRIDYHLPKNSTALRCLSRRAVNAVTEIGKYHHQLYLRIQKTGYPSCCYSYQSDLSDHDKKSFIKGCDRLIRLMVFNSLNPLRWVSQLGMLGSFVAFLFASYSIVVNLVNTNIVAGWTTTVLFISFLFMLQFIILAFFAEYLGRLLNEINHRSDYSIVYEKNSSIMIDENRINVLHDSIAKDPNKVQTGRDR